MPKHLNPGTLVCPDCGHGTGGKSVVEAHLTPQNETCVTGPGKQAITRKDFQEQVETD